MKANLLTRHNGVGLSSDVEMLTGVLAGLGVQARFQDWKTPPEKQADLGIYLELINPVQFDHHRYSILVPNPEWFLPKWMPLLKFFDQVWMKSRASLPVFGGVKGARVVYTGWTSRDLCAGEIQREERCLHLKGKAMQKGTGSVLAAWKRNPALPELLIVTTEPLLRQPELPNVRYEVGYHAPEKVRAWVNGCLYHTCPSEVEGYGHYIAEAMSAGGIVMTTDAPPMSEIVDEGSGFLIPAESHHRDGFAVRSYVTPEAISRAMRKALGLTDEERAGMQARARAKWEADRRAFTERIKELITLL